MTKERIPIAISIVIGFIILSFSYYWVNTSGERAIKKSCHQDHIVLRSGNVKLSDTIKDVKMCMNSSENLPDCIEIEERFKDHSSYQNKDMQYFYDKRDAIIEADYLECVKIGFMRLND